MPTKSITPNGGNYGVTGAQAVPTAATGPAASQQLVRDPVCGMEISLREAAASTEVPRLRPSPPSVATASTTSAARAACGPSSRQRAS